MSWNENPGVIYLCLHGTKNATLDSIFELYNKLNVQGVNEMCCRIEIGGREIGYLIWKIKEEDIIDNFKDNSI